MKTAAPHSESVEKLFASGGAPVHIRPEHLFGWREDAALDVRSYDRFGLHHPKDPDYYDSLWRTCPDPDIWRVYKSVIEVEKLDDPVLVYLHRLSRENEYDIFVLDGATRTTCISYARARKPGLFEEIPVVLFEGTFESARIEMTRRNLENRRRSLNAWELVQAVGHMVVDRGVSELEAGRMCGIEGRGGLVRQCVRAYKAPEEALEAFREERITFDQVLEVLSFKKEDQKDVLEHILNGKSARSFGVKKKTSKSGDPGTIALRQCTAAHKAMDVLLDTFGNDRDQRTEIKEAYLAITNIRAKVMKRTSSS